VLDTHESRVDQRCGVVRCERVRRDGPSSAEQLDEWWCRIDTARVDALDGVGVARVSQQPS